MRFARERNIFLFAVILIGSIYSIMPQDQAKIPSCSDTWGTRNTAKAIEAAMFDGDESAVTATIDRAKAIRGNRIGCSEAAITYEKPNFTEPSLASIEQVWQKAHEPQIASFKLECPTAARRWGYIALGAYYAALSGQRKNESSLSDIARLYAATQYSDTNAAFPPVRRPGMFGYIAAPAGDACFDQTSIAGRPLGGIVNQFCDSKTFPCEVYDAGLFKGKRFLIADTDPPTRNFDGGAAYDHAVAGVMMIEASLQLTNDKDRKNFLESARLAGDWSIAEPSVRNHNYTAKLVWLLAELYGLTGEQKYKAAMLDKFDRNLKLGVLMDLNGDGVVDGTKDMRFDQLTPTAQRPGRMWDGHNARPVYHAMNAFALVEAYVALRDRRDKKNAARIRPYALAMLDNISWEINNLGVPNSGRSQIPYSLLLGLWKIAAYENERKPDWEKALAAIWNAEGIAREFGEGTLVTGLFLLHKSGKKYEPLEKRRH